jgi:hypothetical protein
MRAIVVHEGYRGRRAAGAGPAVAQAATRPGTSGDVANDAYYSTVRVKATRVACAPARRVARAVARDCAQSGLRPASLSFVLQERTWDCWRRRTPPPTSRFASAGGQDAPP